MKRIGTLTLQIWLFLLFAGCAAVWEKNGPGTPVDGDADETLDMDTEEFDTPVDGDAEETPERETQETVEREAEEATEEWCEGPNSVSYEITACGGENERRYPSCDKRSYDSNGRLLSSYYYYNECGVPSPRDYCTSTSYGPEGEILAARFDLHCDGVPECYMVNDPVARTIFRKGDVESCATSDNYYPCRLFTYDAHGNILSQAFDADCTGIFNSNCVRMTYDEHDRLIGMKSDNDCNGVFERDCYKYTYDEHGNMLREERDYSCNGEIDARCQLFDYDAQGNMLAQKYDNDCDGLPEAGCYFYTYDDNGRVLTGKYDGGCDPQSTGLCRVSRYDSQGRLAFTGEDYGCDGAIDSRCTTYSYDAGGRLQNERHDSYCDSSFVYCYMTDFSCFPP